MLPYDVLKYKSALYSKTYFLVFTLKGKYPHTLTGRVYLLLTDLLDDCVFCLKPIVWAIPPFLRHVLFPVLVNNNIMKISILSSGI